MSGDGCRVKIWDTVGQHNSSSSPLSFCKDVDGFIIMFDLTNKESFAETSEWIEAVRNQRDLATYPFILVGNKLDLCQENRQVPKGGPETLALMNGT